ncbi:pentatricopeptide repeat-containing protein At1g03100, mitochondrial [Nymphaea colorata]|uniref:pentatricopeptide repeat-containing protein At1g03100, mitochondrial n=1 Tax=Nymphaea colorata TaxID=210225 RepID=UPI00129D980B|nr:pentatricopeptide repeat-containing protein At1g03100, mitochondrial [Nymphaea colorata]XP_031492435.1 pentatricopeptide repeat-containing protein At1g03100, mitochondrial [Nymphaea colorata]XP_031492443.1 pentatricopeptide repeat-containing protein At1g03100, mitochondrial [Nymphaea colorata]XP_031492467.1 pentatricopeptide repeat-containing protein At1g03100, mitochondrial [Nymphaea colorata]XP_049936352.1 pentatricopeptide repeat-containing protein At1g03100, mitochondrial [Nymphaea color
MTNVRLLRRFGYRLIGSLSAPNLLPVVDVGNYRPLFHARAQVVGQGSCNRNSIEPAYCSKCCCSSQASASFTDESILVRARDPSQLALELGNALDERRYEDAWNAYERYKQIEGFPRKSVINKLICCLAESQDRQWLDKAYGVTVLAFDEHKRNLLEKDTLLFLSYVLARAGLPVPASTILRKMVQMEEFPSINAWSSIAAYMSLSASGAWLAAEMVLEKCHFFKDNRVDPRKKSNSLLLAMKPNALVFNICLSACLVHGSTRKAEQLLEMMPRIGLKADVTLLIMMAHICEKNGRIDEIKKLRRHIDESCQIGDRQYQEFYNCLLTCHLNFGDLKSASEIVLEMLRKAKEARVSLKAAMSVVEAIESHKQGYLEKTGTGNSLGDNSFSSFPRPTETSLPSFVDFCQDWKYLRLETEAKALLSLLLHRISNHVYLVGSENGILYPTEKVYAKLVRAFLELRKVADLAAFLISANKEETPMSIENSIPVQVIHACISVGKLEEAHDLLDEMRVAGVRTGSSVYSSLLKAYCRLNKIGEITCLLNDARKCGVQLDASCYEALIHTQVSRKDIHGALGLFKEMKEARISSNSYDGFDSVIKECEASGQSKLMVKLLEEINDDQKLQYGVHDWNNVIHFFCKKQLMQDARKALKKMKALGHLPNAQTFHSLVTGYSAVGGKYQEIAELWGEMKMFPSSAIRFDQELLDSVLYNFVRGGFFQRANEVVNMMEHTGMFIDKFKYRQLFLKYHRTLYKNKKASNFQTEAQCRKREEALVFKSWVGLT